MCGAVRVGTILRLWRLATGTCIGLPVSKALVFVNADFDPRRLSICYAFQAAVFLLDFPLPLHYFAMSFDPTPMDLYKDKHFIKDFPKGS